MSTTPELADVECPKCHRIDFGWSANPRTFCADCAWVIRPTPVDNPYGYDLLIEVRGQSGRAEKQEKHYKGSESRARNQAKRVPCFTRVLAAVPLSEAQWIAAYGEGKM